MASTGYVRPDQYTNTMSPGADRFGNLNPNHNPTYIDSDGVVHYMQPDNSPEEKDRVAQMNADARSKVRRNEAMAMFDRENTSTGTTPAQIPAVEYPDTTAADAVNFARGKDQAAQTGRASINAMQEELAGRGMLGGGVEANMVGQKVQQAAGHVNEITRQQTVEHATSARQRAQQEYEGKITQRGQDISNANALAQRRQQRLLQIMSLY